MPPSDPAPQIATLSDALRRAAQSLRDAGLDDPAAEARWLIAAAARIAPVELVVAANRPLDPGLAARIEDFIRRRSAREPLSRILGQREFYGRDFLLSEGTLDPRPDTETLIDLALEICAALPPRDRPLEILDIGTGTGAILLTLLAELKTARGIGIDISEDALNTARANAARLGLEEQASFAFCDLRAGVDTLGPRRFDLIVSNPPYIASEEIPQLQPEVRLHDPVAALDGGVDGLDFYRLLAGANAALAPVGWLAFEVGVGQAKDVTALLTEAAPGAIVRKRMDLAGHTRVVAVQPRSGTIRE